MAEQVQASLDKMVRPLADLMDRNIFSQSEIHAIVARRRESEYLLRRRVPRKADFLRYIQDELQLEKLRQLRTKKQQALERKRLQKLQKGDETQTQNDNDATGSKKNHIGDPHIVQHIHLLFRRALLRYNKEGVSVYLQYADVCKELKSFNRLPQIYAEAVQIHPHSTGLWIEAASHEYFHRTSVGSARILLQRALRINKTAKDLWWQSFALEFHHIAKMKGRQSVLQLDSSDAPKTRTGTNDVKDNIEESELNSPLFIVAKIVYDNAIKAIPDDVSFRLGFLDLCKSFSHTETMEAYIVKSIRRDFKDTPKAWIARAARLLEQEQQQQQEQQQGEEGGKSAPKGFIIAPEDDDSSSGDDNEDDESDDAESESSEDSSTSRHDDENVEDDDNDRPAKKQRTSGPVDAAILEKDPVLAMVQKGLQAVPTSEMYLEVVPFLWMYWERAEEVFSDTETVAATRERILGFLQSCLDDVSTSEGSNIYNASLALQHADYYVRVDQPDNCRQVLARFVETSLNRTLKVNPPVEIWIKLAESTFQVQSAASACEVLREALKHTSISHSAYLQLLLQLLGAELATAHSKGEDEKGRKIVTATFQKVLLLASSGAQTGVSLRGSSDGNELLEESTSFGLTSVEHACFQFLLFGIKAFGPLQGVRKTCNMVLLQSKLFDQLDAKSGRELDKLVAFFDKCFEVEIDNLRNSAILSKSERKKGRVCLRQLCKAAVRLFREIPSLADRYQQLQHEALLL